MNRLEQMSALNTRVLDYQRTGAGLEELIDRLSPRIYYYPRHRPGLDEDDCGDFYVYFYPRLIRTLKHFREQGKVFAAETFYDPPTEMQDKEHRGNISATYGFGTQGAEVEVDTETGQVKILKMVIADDVGRALNPLLVEGQLEGGLSMGIGYALLEKLMIDKGEVMNPNLLDYKLPTAKDMPPVDIVFIETDDPAGPFGAKGIAESGVIPTAAAINNAIADALGFHMYELPIQPESLLAAIKARKKSQKE